MPRFSIVIPSLNQGQFLGEAIESIISQEYPDLELFVVDGGSSDESVDVIKRYSKDTTWSCSEPDNGQADAINKGFSRSTGAILGWLNADDQLAPGSLYRIATFFSKRADVDVAYGHRVLIDDNGYEVGRWILPWHSDKVLSWADYVPQETMYWRRSIWTRVGGKVDESFRFAMDWDLLLRFREAHARMVRLPHFLGFFRLHPNQKTAAHIENTGFPEMQRLRARTLGYEPSPLRIAIGVLGYLMQARMFELWYRARNAYDV